MVVDIVWLISDDLRRRGRRLARNQQARYHGAATKRGQKWTE
jgi:hypothetical protein